MARLPSSKLLPPGGHGPTRRIPTSSTSSAAFSTQRLPLPPEVIPPEDSSTPPATSGGAFAAAAAGSQRHRGSRGGRRHLAGCVLTWRALHRVLLLAVALGGALGCCGGVLRVWGQEVVLSADSAGCIANKAPGPPTKLKASPKDGRVLLSWSPPSDGACVTAYVINVIDPLFRAETPAQSTSTGGRTAIVEGLTNGRTYIFQVQAYSSQLRTGGVAQVTATPTELCNLTEAPGKPTNLRVQTGAAWARLCWDGVENDACVDQYRVSAKLLDGPDFRTSSDGKISRGACANVTGLTSGSKYRFSVTAASAAQGQGQAASLVAEVGPNAAAQNGWTCRPVDGCAPSRGGLCSSGGGCAAVARRGDCKVPAMLDVDWVNQQVTQWCASACPCELVPVQGALLMGQPRGLGVADGRLAAVGTAGLATALGSGVLAAGRASAGGNGPSLNSAANTRQQQQQQQQNAVTLPLVAGTPGSLIAAADGGVGGAGSLLAQSRVGQFMGNVAQDVLTSGVLGEAAGKIAQQMVANQVNAAVQAMWGGRMGAVAGAAAGGGAGGVLGIGGRRLLMA